MDAGIGAGRQVDSGVGRRGLKRQFSSTTLLNHSGMSERANIDAINASRVNALMATVNRYTGAVSKLLLSIKETLEKRGIIESVFRVLQVRRANRMRLLVLRDMRYVSRGARRWRYLTISFLVVPSENKRDKYVSSQVTKDTLCRILKSADCSLNVRRISYIRDNGVRIETFSSDIEKIKAHPGLAGAGLTVRENMKLNPRLIIHGVATGALPAVEVTPAVRRTLLGSGRIYLCYSVCLFADHVRIVQCYRYLLFDHIAKDCKDKPSCRHCAGAYEMKDCRNRGQLPKCLNCEHHHVSHGDLAYFAMNAAKCSVLGRRVKENSQHQL
ncbi:hypothetical protein ACFW04_013740 [Cataglyphis niger]